MQVLAFDRIFFHEFAKFLLVDLHGIIKRSLAYNSNGAGMLLNNGSMFTVMADITIYTLPGYPRCVRAKELLKSKGGKLAGMLR